MNDCEVSVNCESPEQTEVFGELLGRNLKGGEVIELISDLGGGKTTLTRGIARGARSSDVVGSPTFVVSKVYKAPKYDIHHFDFYRLTEAGLMEHELQDVLGDKNIVVVVEWGDVVKYVLPSNRITIEIKKTSDEGRDLLLKYPEDYKYLMDKS